LVEVLTPDHLVSDRDPLKRGTQSITELATFALDPARLGEESRRLFHLFGLMGTHELERADLKAIHQKDGDEVSFANALGGLLAFGLYTLVNKTAAQPIVRVHGLLCAEAARRLQSSEAAEQYAGPWARHFFSLVTKVASTKGPEKRDQERDVLRPRLPHLLKAWEWADRLELVEALAVAAHGIGFLLRGHRLDDAERWLKKALAIEEERGDQPNLAFDDVESRVPVVMPKNIRNRRFSTEDTTRIDEADETRLACHRVQTGDLVYSRRGAVDKHAFIGSREVGWLCGTGCLLVRPGPGWPSPLYLSLALDRADTRAWISQHAFGATMPNLNTGILADVPLLTPTEALLKAFATLVRPLDERAVANNHNQNQTLGKTRDGLLPRLLSGELRIKDAENLVSAHT
jgi:hypothetical protein